MTAPTPVPSGPAGGRAGLRGRLIEAAARALWAGGGTALRVERRPIDFVHLAVGTQNAYRADAADTLDAVLPLLADEIEAHERRTYGDAFTERRLLCDGPHWECHARAAFQAHEADAALLRSLTEEQR